MLDEAVRRDLTAMIKAIDKSDTMDAARRLKEFAGPTLIAWASEDKVFPLHFAEELQCMIPGSSWSSSLTAEPSFPKINRNFSPRPSPDS